MNNIDRQIGLRIKEFALMKSGSISKFAREISMAPVNLMAYISGARTPGATILIRLANQGADINWILTGQHFSSGFVSILNEHDIYTEEQLRKRLDIDATINMVKEILKKHFK